MKNMIKFPSIDQFRTAIKEVNNASHFVGVDENGKAIFDGTLKKPILKFKGTVKLHGTNAGICYNKLEGIWSQSRNRIITPEDDHAGFASFVEKREMVLLDMMSKISSREDIDTVENTISIYGEWCGRKIAKGVAISEILHRSFFIFGIKVTPNDNSDAYWVDYSYLKNEDSRIYNVDDFSTYEIEIDFNKPQLIQTTLHDLTMKVEEECPVAKQFGHSGIGEGIVWTGNFKAKNIRFKTKGEKHAKGYKVKAVKKVDSENIQRINDLVDTLTPAWRLDQMLVEICDLINDGEIDRKHIGNYIRAVITDIRKEESDVIEDKGFKLKDLTKQISQVAREYFLEREKGDHQ